MPVSCLVVIHSGSKVLLLERADNPGFWQSVTGSWESGEALRETAVRELFEETGFRSAQGVLHDYWWANQYEIYLEWRGRYAPGVRFNTEHVFGFELAECVDPLLAEREHTHFEWVSWEEAAEQVFSPSNQEAIRWVFGRQPF